MRGWGKDQGRSEHNSFYVTEWKGPAGPVPNSSVADRAGAAKYVEEALALFLIVVEPNIFWSYAWFYGMEDGWASPECSCDDAILTLIWVVQVHSVPWQCSVGQRDNGH